MKRTVIGIIAHVDAGKTTLAEAILYKTGRLRAPGRVDKGDTLLDTHELERERGITIFSGQSYFTLGEHEIALIDTPGHVDFSAETERSLRVLDYAILVISGTDGVQAHTRTLWRLLEAYRIPTFIFITKCDFARKSKTELLAELRGELCPAITDLSAADDAFAEEIAMLDESVLERYLSDGTVSEQDIASLIRRRLLFPCRFGSGLRMEGVDEFLHDLERYLIAPDYPESFGARVYKIAHDERGNRVTHLKITGGTLRVRDVIAYRGREEKAAQLRLYSGEKFTAIDEAEAGSICAVIGLSAAECGDGLGYEKSAAAPLLEPVMNYRIVLPQDIDPMVALPRLRRLEAEDPQLHIAWNENLRQISVGLMGTVQAEILKSVIRTRLSYDVEIEQGQVMYKETIEETVEGVGHYEPLRHYSEVHLLLEPLPRGSGIRIESLCNSDVLDTQYQGQVLTALASKQHVGVLIGAPITDIKITLCSGKAHIKHTEGGDFREAALRAVRCGLMRTRSVLLEPYYSFRIELPSACVGHAMSDIRRLYGSFEPPEASGDISILCGKAPVSTMIGYAAELASYTEGRGRLSLDVCGYERCHDEEHIVEEAKYLPEADLENTPDSVFCEHGGGFVVKWNKIEEYMHLPSVIKKDEPAPKKRMMQIGDDELASILSRIFGPKRRSESRMPAVVHNDRKEKSYIAAQGTKYLIVDGYNVIYSWDELSSLAKTDLEHARLRLMHILANYSAFTLINVTLVFDAYNVEGGADRIFEHKGITVVYTKKNETADAYIERLAASYGKNDKVRVVTSDSLIQLSAIRTGVMRMSAAEFEREVSDASEQIGQILEVLGAEGLSSIGEQLAPEKEK